MHRNDILASAKERIRQHRTADVELYLSDEAGRSLPNVRVDLQLTRHEFKFGCNAYMLGSIPDRELQQAYEERFTALLNYATLPFYWSGYEQSENVTQEERLQRMAEWCEHNQITTKGHPLVWHETFPEWGKTYSDNAIVSRLETRVREIVSRFKDTIQVWDVVNEATVAHRVDNAVGRWIANDGAVTCVERALQWAREANPSATLLYNDFNISDDFEALVGSLCERGAPMDVIGIQSHMHRGPWPLERVWQVCETYARYGLPLHWTETTVLSGRWKAQDDDDWHTQRTDWKTTVEGEVSQADYGEAFYTVLFSHPAVEAITWWDLSDYGSWQGAPAGLIREDMSPKPLYERLFNLVKQEWGTEVQTTSDGEEKVRARCFFGEHAIKAYLVSGTVLNGSFTVHREEDHRISVVVK